MLIPSVCTAAEEPSQVSHARRIAVDLARRGGFSATEQGTVGIVVTEAANNLVKHARGGALIFRPLIGKVGSGLEIISIDKGPGMADVARCLEDGYSTAGSPGTGLGAISRMASLFDVYSRPGAGTVMVIQVWTEGYAAGRRRSRLEFGAVSLPVALERVSGDAWSFAEEIQTPLLLVVDGLGHGEGAAEAAAEAVRVFEQSFDQPPVELLGRIHQALKATRGAAAALVAFDFERRMLQFVGIGNISGQVWDGRSERHFVSSHGIVGHTEQRMHQYEYPWPLGSTIIMASDGLQTHWSAEAYPGIRLRHASIWAGALYRDFQRSRDDVTVVVIRERITP